MNDGGSSQDERGRTTGPVARGAGWRRRPLRSAVLVLLAIALLLPSLSTVVHADETDPPPVGPVYDDGVRPAGSQEFPFTRTGPVYFQEQDTRNYIPYANCSNTWHATFDLEQYGVLNQAGEYEFIVERIYQNGAGQETSTFSTWTTTPGAQPFELQRKGTTFYDPDRDFIAVPNDATFPETAVYPGQNCGSYISVPDQFRFWTTEANPLVASLTMPTPAQWVGDDATVVLEITNDSDTPITEISFESGDGLGIRWDDDVFELVDEPTRALPLELAPHETVSLTYGFHRIGDDEVEIASDIEGVHLHRNIRTEAVLDGDAADQPLTGAFFRVDSATDKTVEVGEIAPVRLRIANQSGKEITGLQLVHAGVAVPDGMIPAADLRSATEPLPGESEVLALPATLAASGPSSVGFADFLIEGIYGGLTAPVSAYVRGTMDGEQVSVQVDEDWEVLEPSLDVSIDFDPPAQARSAVTDEGAPAPIEMTATITVRNQTGETVESIGIEAFEISRVSGDQQLRLEQTGGLPVTNADAPGILESQTADELPEPFDLTNGTERTFTAGFRSLTREPVELSFLALGDRQGATVRGAAEETWDIAPSLCVRIDVEETLPVDGSPVDPCEAHGPKDIAPREPSVPFDVTVTVGADDPESALSDLSPTSEPVLVLPDWLEVVTAPDLPDGGIELPAGGALRTTWTVQVTEEGEGVVSTAWTATTEEDDIVSGAASLPLVGQQGLQVCLEITPNPLNLAAASEAAGPVDTGIEESELIGTKAGCEDIVDDEEDDEDGEPDEGEDDDEGEGQEPSAIADVWVRVHNPTDQAVTSVAIPTLELTQPVDEEGNEIPTAEILEGPLLPFPADDLGDLEPGETSIPVKFLVRGLKGGDVDVVAKTEATSGDEKVPGRQQDVFEVDDAKVVMDIEPRGVGTRVDGSQYALSGSTWRLEGTIRNNSLTETVVVDLGPYIQGNGTLGTVTSDSPGLAAQSDSCPVFPRLVVPPDSEISVALPITASRILKNGQHLVHLTLVPTVEVEAIEDEVLDAPIPVPKAEWDLRRDGASIKLNPVYVVDVEVARLEIDRGAWESGYVVTSEAAAGLAQFAKDVGALIWGAGEVAVAAAAGDVIDPETVGNFNKFAQLVHHVVHQMTEAERDAFIDETTAAIYAETRSLIDDPDERARIRQEVSDFLVDWFEESNAEFQEQAYYDGFFTTVASKLSRFLGENPDVFLGGGKYGASALCRLASRSDRIVTMMDRLKAARGVAYARWSKTLVDSKYLEPGLELAYDAARQAFGIDKETWDIYIEAAKKSGAILTLRRRGLGAIDKLGPPVNAWLKTEAFKSKNVNDLDIEFLGFPAEWKDTVASGTPRPWAEVVADPKFQALSDAQKKAVDDRWRTRAKEAVGDPTDWSKKSIVDELLAMEAQGEAGGAPFPAESIWKEINVNPDDYAALVQSGRTLPPDAVNTRYRQIQLKRFPDEPGVEPRFFQVEVIDDDGVPHVLTGDMDPVAFLEGTGDAVLNPVARDELYDSLAASGVLVHGETQSTEKFTKLLDAHVYGKEGSEPLLAFMPDGRAVISWYDPRKSNFSREALGEDGQQMMFHGITSKLRAEVDIPFGAWLPSYRHRLTFIVEPTRWIVNGLQCLAGAALPPEPQAACQVQLVRDPTGLVLRQPSPGTLEIWTREAGWQSYDPSAPVGGAGLAPQARGTGALTPAAVDAAAVAPAAVPLVLKVQPSMRLVAPLMTGQTDVQVPEDFPFADFRVGEKVLLLDEDGSVIAARTVVGLSPLRLDSPLDQIVDAGTMLVRDPAQPVSGDGQGPDDEDDLDGDDEQGTDPGAGPGTDGPNGTDLDDATPPPGSAPAADPSATESGRAGSAGGSLPATGSSVWPPLRLAAVLLLLGTMLVVWPGRPGRRRQHRQPPGHLSPRQ